MKHFFLTLLFTLFAVSAFAQRDVSETNDTVFYNNGDIYVGTVRKGTHQAHGYGILWTASGNKYTGDFNRGKMEGNGTFIWSTGNTYTGQWKDS